MAFSSPGIGNPLHLAGELFNARAGTKLLHVPYNGGGPAAAAVVAGEVQVMFSSPAPAMPHMKSGKLRALAYTAPTRHPAMPDVPRRLLHPKKRTVGVRIPDHPVVQALLAELGEPLLSSTLLMPGESDPMTDGWQVKDELDHWLDAVIDAGECGSEPTTVVDFSDGAPEVARVGAGDVSRFE